jgi:hypothetical protein
MLKKASLLARQAPASQDAPCPRPGRSSTANHCFTFHTSRFGVSGSEARTPLVDRFSIPLIREKSDRRLAYGARRDRR